MPARIRRGDEVIVISGKDNGKSGKVLRAYTVQEIVDSHCGKVDRQSAARMADAQAARDQEMARLVARYADRGVMLLAGNGHVRKDIGVVRWLPPALQAETRAFGFEGDAAADAGVFDRTVATRVQADRPDPCAAMPARMP